MATKKTLHGKCPRCCPNGGACFTRTYDDDSRPVKKCTNCHLELPLRKVKATGKPNQTQERVLARLKETFGGTFEVKMIGRKVWLSATNENRPWHEGTGLYGTIGPNGAMSLKLSRLFGDPPVITDDIGIDVYLSGRGHGSNNCKACKATGELLANAKENL
jgi:hypothetical protein